MPTAITGLRRPAAVVSPLVELGCALHTLDDPTHHAASSWATPIRAALSPRLATWTASWSWTTRAIRATPFVTTSPGPAGELGPAGSEVGDGVPEAVARLRRVAVERVAGQLLRSVSPRRGGRTAAHWAASRGPAVAASVAALLERPADAVGEFLDFLERSWHRGGVAAGRLLPTGLLRHRYGAVHAALLAELGRLDGDRWSELGPTAQYVFTVPGHQPYWHAALHLRHLPHTHPDQDQPC